MKQITILKMLWSNIRFVPFSIQIKVSIIKQRSAYVYFYIIIILTNNFNNFIYKKLTKY